MLAAQVSKNCLLFVTGISQQSVVSVWALLYVLYINSLASIGLMYHHTLYIIVGLCIPGSLAQKVITICAML